MICDWCGKEHAQTALCTAIRPRLSRRSFLFLSSAAAVGMMLPSLPSVYTVSTSDLFYTVDRVRFAAMVEDRWNGFFRPPPPLPYAAILLYGPLSAGPLPALHVPVIREPGDNT